MPKPEASQTSSNGLPGSGSTKTGAVVSACLRSLNACEHETFQSNGTCSSRSEPCQICIALNVLEEEIGESQKLQELTQASGLWPINNRLHLHGIRLKTILADDVTQVMQFGLGPNTLRCALCSRN